MKKTVLGLLIATAMAFSVLAQEELASPAAQQDAIQATVEPQATQEQQPPAAAQPTTEQQAAQEQQAQAAQQPIEPTAEPTAREARTPLPPRRPQGTQAAEGYPADEIHASDESDEDCGGKQVVDATAVVPSGVVEGSKARILLQDSLEQTPVASSRLKIVFPSRRAFTVPTSELGIAEFTAVEHGTYRLEAFGCYELYPTAVFAVRQDIPERLHGLPPFLLQPLSENLENLFYAGVLALLLGLAWFAHSFIKQEREEFGEGEESVWDKYRQKLFGRDEPRWPGKNGRKPGLWPDGSEEAQTAIEYLLLLGGVIFVAVIAISIVRSQIAAPVKESIGGQVSNLTGILNSFNQS